MKESTRIGILLFLYTRDELSPVEQEELLAWRNQDLKNEKLFFEMIDPGSLQKIMQDYYQERDRVFEKLKSRLPSLSGARLPGSVDEVSKTISETQLLEGEDLSDPSVNEYAASGLSPVKYWGSMLASLDDDEETDEEVVPENKVVPMSGELKAPKVRRKGRTFRRFLRVAVTVIAIFVVDFVVDYFLSDHRFSNYQAEMVSSNGVRTFLSDTRRAFLAGYAGIRFGKTERGEPIFITPNDSDDSKDKLYTLVTAPGGEFILQLPDSTMIWMNAASTIKYPANFNQDTIRLEVEGEAYIQRSKDTIHHYLIIPSTANRQPPTSKSQPPTITALPSSGIDINTYPGNDEMLVTLIRGAAAAHRFGAENKLQFMNGQQTRIVQDTLAVTREVNTNEIIAWKDNEFYYKDANLQNMMPAIAKWYDVEIKYASQIPDRKFSLRMPRSTELSEVLDSLRKQGLHFTQTGQKITIWN